MRAALAAAGLLLLAGCAGNPPKPSSAGAAGGPPPRVAAGPPGAVATARPEACLQVREHRDEDYTPGGLYAPGVSDSAPAAPLDVSGIPEPVPTAEPPSAYGNRSPYTVLGKRYQVLPSARGYRERGIASWYGQKFHGRQTSSREVYDMCAFTAAHKTLPLPSFVRVTNLDNGRSVVVRVNDRGPFHEGRIIDLSYAAAVKLGVDRTGTARVEVEALSPSERGSVLVAQSPPPVLAPAPSPAPSPAGPPDAVDEPRHIVQVGSYRDQGNARRIAGQLQAAGVDAVGVEQAEVQGQPVWRVRVGPLGLAGVADVLDAVRRLGLPSPRVFSE